jgi:hypothetical protein
MAQPSRSNEPQSDKLGFRRKSSLDASLKKAGSSLLETFDTLGHTVSHTAALVRNDRRLDIIKHNLSSKLGRGTDTHRDSSKRREKLMEKKDLDIFTILKKIPLCGSLNSHQMDQLAEQAQLT